MILNIFNSQSESCRGKDMRNVTRGKPPILLVGCQPPCHPLQSWNIQLLRYYSLRKKNCEHQNLKFEDQ